MLPLRFHVYKDGLAWLLTYSSWLTNIDIRVSNVDTNIKRSKIINKSERVAQLGNYIEENLRALKSAGLEFVDPRNLGTRLKSKQNHVVFGRRGAGKTTLLSPLKKMPNCVAIYLNIEDYKNITFPNIIVSILTASFRDLRQVVKECHPWYKMNFEAIRVCNSLRNEERALENILGEPDQEEQQIRSKISSAEDASASLGYREIHIGGSIKKGSEVEVGRVVPRDKLNDLRLKVSAYKDLFDCVSIICNKPIYLIFDDFYTVPKSIQPDLLDYFHLLTKDTNLFLKVATIKHSSRLFLRASGRPIGAQVGHDIHEIDIDYTLDNFRDLQSFMRQLLEAAIKGSRISLEIDSLFSGDGFKQLCLASGGVPRDFLSLFVRLANRIDFSRGRTIGKVQVTEEAIANFVNKLDSLKVDSADEERVLELYLNSIKAEVYQKKRTNTFLVAKDELELHPQARQAVRALVDLRLIHQIEKSTSSAPSNGQMYEAYILDIGLYDNARPRSFDQIEPGMTDSKSRKDKLRAAPKLSLSRLEAIVESGDVKGKLTITE